MYNERLQEKLRSFSLVDDETTCWEWRGQISHSGHGRIMIRDQVKAINMTVSAETASYIAFIGSVPEGKWVHQTCLNRLCINPEHLTVIESTQF